MKRSLDHDEDIYTNVGKRSRVEQSRHLLGSCSKCDKRILVRHQAKLVPMKEKTQCEIIDTYFSDSQPGEIPLSTNQDSKQCANHVEPLLETSLCLEQRMCIDHEASSSEESMVQRETCSERWIRIFKSDVDDPSLSSFSQLACLLAHKDDLHISDELVVEAFEYCKLKLVISHRNIEILRSGFNEYDLEKVKVETWFKYFQVLWSEFVSIQKSSIISSKLLNISSELLKITSEEEFMFNDKLVDDEQWSVYEQIAKSNNIYRSGTTISEKLEQLLLDVDFHKQFRELVNDDDDIENENDSLSDVFCYLLEISAPITTLFDLKKIIIDLVKEKDIYELNTLKQLFSQLPVWNTYLFLYIIQSLFYNTNREDKDKVLSLLSSGFDNVEFSSSDDTKQAWSEAALHMRCLPVSMIKYGFDVNNGSKSVTDKKVIDSYKKKYADSVLCLQLFPRDVAKIILLY